MNGTHSGTGFGKRAAGLLLFVISQVGNVYSFWDASRPLCLGLAVVVTVTFIIYDGAFSARFTTVAFGVLLVLAILVFILVPPNVPAETEIHGWLMPGRDPAPKTQCDTDKLFTPSSRSLLVLAGTSAAWTDGPGTLQVLNIGNSTILSFEREGNKLAINADLFSVNGNLIARVKHNEFHLVAGEMSYPERSEDRSSLTIYDKRGKDIMYVKFLNPRTVVVRGVFNAPDGSRVEIDDRKMVFFNRSADYTYKSTCNADMPTDRPIFMFSQNGLATN